MRMQSRSVNYAWNYEKKRTHAVIPVTSRTNGLRKRRPTFHAEIYRRPPPFDIGYTYRLSGISMTDKRVWRASERMRNKKEV